MNRSTATLLLVFAVALAVRLAGLGRLPLWYDEAGALEVITAPDRDAMREAYVRSEVGKGPFFYVFLRVFTSVFGTGLIALRLPSAIAGAVAAAAAGAWAAGLSRAFPVCGGRGSPAAAALFAGLAIALHPLSAALAREARSFAFCGAFLFASAAGSVIAYLGVAGVDPARERRWRIYTPLLAALGTSAHLCGGFFVAGLVAATAGGMLARGRPLRLLVPGAALYLIVLAAELPLNIEKTAIFYAAGGGGPEVSWRDIAHYARVLLGGGPAGYAVAAVAIYLSWRGRREGRVLLPLAAGVISFGCVVAAQFLVTPILIGGVRYMAWLAAPLAAVLAAAALGRGPGRSLLGAILLAALATGNFAQAGEQRVYAEDWREVVSRLAAGAAPGDAVLASGRTVCTALRYHGLPGSIVVADLRGPGPEGLRAAAREVKRADGRFFVVWSHPRDRSLDPPAVLAGEFGPPVEILASPAIRVFRFGP
jgi:mannosyltransferase